MARRSVTLARKALTPTGWIWAQAALALRRDHGIALRHFPAARRAHLDLLPPWIDLRGGEIVDIGANVGEWSADLLTAVPNAKLLAIEPEPEAYRRLSTRISRPGVRTAPVAVGDTEGQMPFMLAGDSVFGSLLGLSRESAEIYGVRAEGQIDVDVVMLDSLASPGSVPLIKLDVQGLELEVISGGRQTFARADSVIAEVNFRQFYEGGSTIGPLHDALSELGFVLWRLGEPSFLPDHGTLMADACYVRRPTSR